MLDPGQSPLNQNPDFAEFALIEGKRDAVKKQYMMSKGDREFRNELQQEAAVLRGDMLELVANPDLQQFVAKVFNTAVQQSTELSLHSKQAELSVLEVMEQKAEHQAVISAAEGFFKYAEETGFDRSALTGGLAVRTSVGGPRKQAATKEKPAALDVISILERKVEVGDYGDSVRFDHDQRYELTNFGIHSREALRVIIGKAGHVFKPSEVWNQIYSDGRPYNTGLMQRTMTWLEDNITLGDKSLVMWNGKRGRGSRYFVNPEFAPKKVKLADEVDATQRTEKLQDASQSHEADESLLLQNPGYFTVAALQLAKLEPMLSSFGIDPISVNLSQELRRDMPDLSDFSEHDKRLYRESAYDEIASTLEDEALCGRVRSVLGENSPQARFVTYLSEQFSADGGVDQLRTLLSALVKNKYVTINGVPELTGETELKANGGRGATLWSSEHVRVSVEYATA